MPENTTHTRKRRFARYVDIGGKHDLWGLCEIAREHGMMIMIAVKPNMHVYNEIGLYGTAEAMETTDAAWAAAGHEVAARRVGTVRRCTFGVNLKRSRANWVDQAFAKAKGD